MLTHMQLIISDAWMLLWPLSSQGLFKNNPVAGSPVKPKMSHTWIFNLKQVAHVGIAFFNHHTYCIIPVISRETDHYVQGNVNRNLDFN